MPDRTVRNLAAIVSTDIVGYSRLMEPDEAETLARMKAHRQELWSPVIEKHGGRVVGTAGDSMLVEYGSAVSAIESAIEVQQGMAAREAEMPDDRKMLLRIGVNIGEIVVDGADIYGDGVNVAARLQALADPGGISISAKAHDEVAGKLTAGFADQGEHTVKNIARPIRVWRWIGDGLAEEVITALSRISSLFVIARNSSFAYKGQATDVRRIARDLGVKYTLDGSVRAASERIRVTAQLVDAQDGRHLWAERYDRKLADVFAIQDEITREIVTALHIKQSDGEQAQLVLKGTESVEAWPCAMPAVVVDGGGNRLFCPTNYVDTGAGE